VVAGARVRGRVLFTDESEAEAMMAEDTFQMDAETNQCAHCGQRIVPGDKLIAYIDPKATVPIKMLVHDHCAEAFFGQGVH
jgi:hypothetical protein